MIAKWMSKIPMPPSDLHTEIERQIVQLLATQDAQAIVLIVQHYQNALFGVIFRIVQSQPVAEDVWQESLVKIWRNAQRYDAQKGRLFTWMLNICRRSAIDMTRSKAFKQQANIQAESPIVGMEGRGTASETSIDAIGLTSYVDQLEPKYREVIEYVYLQGYTQAEASEVLDLPLGTLKTRVRTAMNQLRTWLSE